MRLFRPACALAFALVTLAGARGGDFVLFRNVWGDVIVSTDTTKEGRELRPPTPAEPVYYLGKSLGCKLGAISGDQIPEEKQLNRFVADVLAKQGYVGARPGGPEPTLFLIVQWGYLRPGRDDLAWFLGYDPDQDIGAPVMAGILGPEVFRTGFRSRTINTVLDDMRDPIYGIIVTAFEFKSASTPHPIIYWQTRIGLPANGKSMAEALPTMLVAAGPSIGREARSPVLRDADTARQGNVKLGELKILDTFNNPEPAAPDREKK